MVGSAVEINDRNFGSIVKEEERVQNPGKLCMHRITCEG